jgi:hypothetical protein
MTAQSLLNETSASSRNAGTEAKKFFATGNQ